MNPTETYTVAELSGVGTEYAIHYSPDLEEGFVLTVASGGSASRRIESFPTFRAAVLEAVDRIELEIEEETR